MRIAFTVLSLNVSSVNGLIFLNQQENAILME